MDGEPPPPGWELAPAQGPFLENAGPLFIKQGDGETTLALLASDRHANNAGTVMGGMLAAIADHALGRAIAREDQDDGGRVTVSLTVDFLKPANPGDWIESRTSVDRVGGSLAFADCSLVVEGAEVVRARAVFAGGS